MTLRKAALLLFLGFILSLPTCSPLPNVAYLDALITPRDDETGGQSTQTHIYFNEFQYSLVQGNLKLTFIAADPAGDNEMVMILQNSGGNFPTQTYRIDGINQNAFNAAVIIRRDLSPESLTVSSTQGFVNLDAIVVDDNKVLRGVQGEFKVNFTGGGVGEGWFKATN